MTTQCLLENNNSISKNHSSFYQDSIKIKTIEDSINFSIQQRKSINEQDHLSEEVKTNEFSNLQNLFNSPPITNSIDYTSNSQIWVGHVIKISKDKFKAKLFDKSEGVIDHYSSYEIADFDLKDISEGDKELFGMGAIFYWSIGYANKNGQISKQSSIRFKRVVQNITNEDFDRIKDYADELSKLINFE
jgi:hypothetical protein